MDVAGRGEVEFGPQQSVIFYNITRSEEVLVNRTLFELRHDRGWVWLQRAAFWVLSKIGAFHLDTSVVFHRTPGENNNVLDSLVAQHAYWLDAMWHLDRPQIFMGPDDYPELLRLAEFMDMTPVSFSGRIRLGYRTRVKWREIPISVIPWMKGAILVPGG